MEIAIVVLFFVIVLQYLYYRVRIKYRERGKVTGNLADLEADVKWCQKHIELIENRMNADGFRNKKRVSEDAEIMEILDANPANRHHFLFGGSNE